MTLLENSERVYLPSRRVLFGFYLSHYANYSPPPRTAIAPLASLTSNISDWNGKWQNGRVAGGMRNVKKLQSCHRFLPSICSLLTLLWWFIGTLIHLKCHFSFTWRDRERRPVARKCERKAEIKEESKCVSASSKGRIWRFYQSIHSNFIAKLGIKSENSMRRKCLLPR